MVNYYLYDFCLCWCYIFVVASQHTDFHLFWLFDIVFKNRFFLLLVTMNVRKSQDSERWAPTVYYKYTRYLSQYWTNTTQQQKHIFLPYHHWMNVALMRWTSHKEGKLIIINFIFNLECKIMLKYEMLSDLEYFIVKSIFIWLLIKKIQFNRLTSIKLFELFKSFHMLCFYFNKIIWQHL